MQGVILEGRRPLRQKRVFYLNGSNLGLNRALKILIRQTWHWQAAPMFLQSKRGDRISKGLVFEEFQPLVSIPEGVIL